MRKTISISVVILMSCVGLAQPSEGEVMFVGFNADADDGLAIVLLVDLPASTSIYFNDNEWNGSAIGGGGAFNTGEGTVTWTSGGSILGAGTVIVLDDLSSGSPTASTGSISETGNFNIAASSEVIYMYLGSDANTPTTFLSAISNGGFSNGTIANTGLAAGTNATEITGNEDVMAYTGSTTCNTTVADCAATIANSSNWSTEDGSGDQSADGGIDFPGSQPGGFNGSALPVELVSFSAEAIGGKVILEWTTASELNNHGFHVERSFTGDAYTSVAFIDGSGTTSQIKEYSFVDVGSSGGAYYRLTQEDFDGSTEVIGLEYVHQIEVFENISVYPNPTAGTISIEGFITDFRLIDASGKLLLTKNNITSSEASLKITSHLRSSDDGLYFLFTKSGNMEQVIRILKQ